MDAVALVSSCFGRNKKVREVKVLAVLEYMFHGIDGPLRGLG